MQLTDDEKDALLGVFTIEDNQPTERKMLRERVLPYYIAIIILLVITFSYIQLMRPEIITHYMWINSFTASKAEMFIFAKALITFTGVLLISVAVALGKGLTMVSLLFLLMITNGFVEDITARLATPNAIFDMKMNVITILRLTLIGVVSRVSYLCIFRTKK